MPTRKSPTTKKRTVRERQSKSKPLDIGDAFKFVLRDPDWKRKIGLGVLITITGIGVFALIGWGLVIQRNIIKGNKAALPEWRLEYLGLGFRYLSAFLIWTLPFQIFNCWYLLYSFNQMAKFMEIYQNWNSLAPLPQYTPDQLILNSQPVIYLTAFVGAILSPVVSGLFAESNSIAKTLRLRYATTLFSKNWRQFLLVSLLAAILNRAISLGPNFLVCLSVLLLPAINAATSSLYGQAFRNAKRKLAASS